MADNIVTRQKNADKLLWFKASARFRLPISDGWPELFTWFEIALLQYPDSKPDQRALENAIESAFANELIKATDCCEVADGPQTRSHRRSKEIPLFNSAEFMKWFNGLDTTSEYIKAWVNAWQTQEQTEDKPSIEQSIIEGTPDDWLNSDMSKLDKQVRAIQETIKAMEFDPLKIPDGKKSKIEHHCSNCYPLLFSAPTAFETAWKEGNGELWKIFSYDSYSKRGKD